MRRIIVIATISAVTWGFSPGSLATTYKELYEQITSIAEMLKSDEKSEEACSLFADFQKQRDAFLAEDLGHFTRRNLEKTQKDEGLIKNFCEKIPSQMAFHLAKKHKSELDILP
jgi:hypothetical protein